MGRVTHTYVELEVSEEAYDEVARLLCAAGYEHAFIDGVIDMHGIALTKRVETDERKAEIKSLASDIIDALIREYRRREGKR